MQEPYENNQYNTQDEIRWLNSIGCHAMCGVITSSKKELLERYIQSAKNRKHWGEIIPGTSIAHAKKLLESA